MDFSKLDELMAMPKKTDASKQNKKCFVDQMGILLGEEGLSENAIKYLKSGFGFAGAKPLAIYIQKYKDEERNRVVDAVFSSELLCGKDKVSAFKFCVNLSAYSIEWFGSDKHLLTGLVKLFPSLSQNKEKKLLKDAPKIFEKYFLEILSVDTALPDLYALGLKEIFIKEYMGTLQLISDSITKKYAEKNRKIKEWIRLSGEKNAEDRLVQPHSEECKSQESAIDNNNQGENTTEEANNEIAAAYSAKEILKLGLLFSDISSRLKVTAEKIMELERQYAGSKEQIAKLKLEIKQNEEEIQNERKHYEQEKTETERCRGIIADLQDKIRDASVQNQEQEKKIMSLSEELSKANAVLSVYSVDKQNAQTEQLNAIASKLKAEYRDFKEAENEEMTVDLGENFRFQIQSIFKILSKSGIEVERR